MEKRAAGGRRDRHAEGRLDMQARGLRRGHPGILFLFFFFLFQLYHFVNSPMQGRGL